jgi:hypothetical protein
LSDDASAEENNNYSDKMNPKEIKYMSREDRKNGRKAFIFS